MGTLTWRDLYPASVLLAIDKVCADVRKRNEYPDCRVCPHLGDIVQDKGEAHNYCHKHRTWTNLLDKGMCLDTLDDVHREHNRILDEYNNKAASQMTLF